MLGKGRAFYQIKYTFWNVENNAGWGFSCNTFFCGPWFFFLYDVPNSAEHVYRLDDLQLGKLFGLHLH